MFSYILQVNISHLYFIVLFSSLLRLPRNTCHAPRVSVGYLKLLCILCMSLDQYKWLVLALWRKKSPISPLYCNKCLPQSVYQQTHCLPFYWRPYSSFEAFGSCPTVILFWVGISNVFTPCKPASVYFKPDMKSPIECTILTDGLCRGDGLVMLFVWTLTKVNC